MFRLTLLWCALELGYGRAAFSEATAPTKTEPGLMVTFRMTDGAKVTDITAAQNVWLYVPAGKSPTPFLPGGKFETVWEGFVTVDKTADYLFQAELNGSLYLEINGEAALDAMTNGAAGKPAKLNRGPNALKARFTSPASGDALVRLQWGITNGIVLPIPLDALSRTADTAELKQANARRLGRELFAEYRCAKCHTVPATADGMPELAMDAPSLEESGARLNYDWMARWIADPRALRPTARMPKLLHGPDAEAIAAYLASLGHGAGATMAGKGAEASAGRDLADTLHCAACHNLPGGDTEPDPTKIFFQHVAEKFADGALADFLLKPDAHYAWIRMPNFKLSRDEANKLAAYLVSIADKPKGTTTPTDNSVIERGKKLVQTSGCLNCHTLKLKNEFTAKSLADLSAAKWSQGCLGAAHSETEKSPEFSFTDEQLAALQAFGATDHAALGRHVPAEFAEREARELNCRECHGKVEGFPAFDQLGGKLKPEWAKAFIGGEITWKPRPWLEARMPSFASRAGLLAQGLAMSHGFPPQTAPEPPVDAGKAKIGQKLVSAVGGFSCVTCHGVGDVPAAQNSDGLGVNFAHTSERILRPYFFRWVQNPQAIDPTTKMPMYFDEQGRSPLKDVYGGDTVKQLDAIWEYFRLGDKMPPPPTP